MSVKETPSFFFTNRVFDFVSELCWHGKTKKSVSPSIPDFLKLPFLTFCILNFRNRARRGPKGRGRRLQIHNIKKAKNAIIQEGTNVHFSNLHFVLCQDFCLHRLTPPFHAFSPPPSSLLLQDYCFHTK